MTSDAITNFSGDHEEYAHYISARRESQSNI
jgi:hypothetical protein